MEEKNTLPTSESVAEPEIVTCAECQCNSTLPELFRRTWRGWLCPKCLEKRQINSSRVLFVSVIVILVIGFACVWSLDGNLDRNLLVLLFALVVLPLSLVFHEFAHATAAWLTGGTIFGIHVGMGKHILRQKVKQVVLSLSLLPLSGFCHAGFPYTRFIRLRYAIFLSGGLLFHLIVVLLFQAVNIGSGQPTGLMWKQTVVGLNGFLLIVNLWPRQFQTAVGPFSSDGRALWHLLRGKTSSDDIYSSYYVMKAVYAYQDRDSALAIQVSEAGLTLYPDNDHLKNLCALAMLDAGRYQEGFEIWKEIVNSEPLLEKSGFQRALFFNNFAWSALMNEAEPDHIDIAYEYAKRAFMMAPWVPYIQGTFGSVLIESGQYEKGIECVLDAAKELKRSILPTAKENMATNLAYAAIGYHRLGQKDKARTILDEAQTIFPEEVIVKKAIAELTIIPRS